ncbi:MAG: hypothetical protein WC696_08845 [Candidatus Methylopumilus sp.]|jgi:hypothetical protein
METETETETLSQEVSCLHQDIYPQSNPNDSELTQKKLAGSTDLSITNNFGVEVQEVGFVEFDRRKKTSSGVRAFKYERRGFLENLESLIRDLDRT